mmetsp:Transcript_47688/g.138950  ORF Transcript_47688/g.138950 Transcript_47688/m.138950 type:complete len:428 (+) Transcript_47688:1091-2374(+)
MVDAGAEEESDVGVPHMPMHTQLIQDRRQVVLALGAPPGQLCGDRRAAEAPHDDDTEAAATEHTLGGQAQVGGIDKPMLLRSDIRHALEHGGQGEVTFLGQAPVEAGEDPPRLRGARDALRQRPRLQHKVEQARVGHDFRANGVPPRGAELRRGPGRNAPHLDEVPGLPAAGVGHRQPEHTLAALARRRREHGLRSMRGRCLADGARETRAIIIREKTRKGASADRLPKASVAQEFVRDRQACVQDENVSAQPAANGLQGSQCFDTDFQVQPRIAMSAHGEPQLAGAPLMAQGDQELHATQEREHRRDAKRSPRTRWVEGQEQHVSDGSAHWHKAQQMRPDRQQRGEQCDSAGLREGCEALGACGRPVSPEFARAGYVHRSDAPLARQDRRANEDDRNAHGGMLRDCHHVIGPLRCKHHAYSDDEDD